MSCSVDDGRGAEDPLHLVVEIKGYRGEDAKDKKGTMDTYWVPGVNALGAYGRWDFAEFTDVYDMEDAFDRVIAELRSSAETEAGKWLAEAGGSAPELEYISRRQSK